MTVQVGGGGVERRIGGNTAAATEVEKPQTFDRTPSKVSRFVGACKLYIRMRLRESSVEEQIQWVLVIRREYGQTLGLGLVDKNRTVGNY